MNNTNNVRNDNHQVPTRNTKTELVQTNKISLSEVLQLEELFTKRATMCLIGMDEVKDLLNHEANAGDMKAKILNLALKMEEKRLSSMIDEKDSLKNNPNRVSASLEKLIRLIRESRIGDYGNTVSPCSIFDFQTQSTTTFCIDLPADEQISFVVPSSYKNYFKTYEKEQRNLQQTNLTKIENAINKLYGKAIAERYRASVGNTTNVELPNIIIKKHAQEGFAEIYKVEEIPIKSDDENKNVNSVAMRQKERPKLTSKDVVLGRAIEKQYWSIISFEDLSQLKELYAKRASMCGIGTRKLKNFLNQKAKEGDKAAEILYIALKLEDKRISSRLYDEKYQSKRLNEMTEYETRLLRLIEESKIGDYGYIVPPYCDFAYTKSYSTTLCIDLPGDEQIGFDTYYNRRKKSYRKAVKKPRETNLTKIENAINKLYSEQILKKYGDSAEDSNVRIPDITIKVDKAHCTVIRRKYYPTSY